MINRLNPAAHSLELLRLAEQHSADLELLKKFGLNRPQIGYGKNGLIFYRDAMSISLMIPDTLDPKGRKAEVYLEGHRQVGPGLAHPEILIGPEEITSSDYETRLTLIYAGTSDALRAASDHIAYGRSLAVDNEKLSEFRVDFALNSREITKTLTATGFTPIVFPGVKSSDMERPTYRRSNLHPSSSDQRLISLALENIRTRLFAF